MIAALWLGLAALVGAALGKLLLDGPWWIAPLALLAWTALCLFGRAKKHFRRALLVVGALAIACGGALVYGVYHAGYTPTDSSFPQSAFFSQSALVLVPHQDDELNLAAAAIRYHVDAGARVTVAFSTNGDYAVSADERVAEALSAARALGVTDVRLLGYGDSPYGTTSLCDADGVVQSAAGHTQTYGALGIPDEHTRLTGAPADYTQQSLLSDIQTLIERERPQVIYVNELDIHPDHKTLSRLFDRAMNAILRAHPDYQPTVLKGLAYEGAWTAYDDFYALPWRSVIPAYTYNTKTTSPDLFWSDRIRMPVPQSFRAYTLRSSAYYALLGCYAKRGAVERATRILNGDAVYWLRRTDNLALRAEVSATAPNAALLTDYMLCEPSSIESGEILSGCWYADAGDSFTLRWDEPQTIGTLRLLSISPSGGFVSSVEVYADGALCKEATWKAVGAHRVDLGSTTARELRVVVTGVSGEQCGFTEAEAFAPEASETRILLVAGPEWNVLYEYACEANQALTLNSYAWPRRPAEATVALTRADGTPTAEQPEYVVKNGKINIPALPKGVYRLRLTAGTCYDEIVLRVGDTLWYERLLQYTEQRMDRAIALAQRLAALLGL